MRELFVSYTVMLDNCDEVDGDIVCKMNNGETLHEALTRVKAAVKQKAPEVARVVVKSVYITPIM